MLFTPVLLRQKEMKRKEEKRREEKTTGFFQKSGEKSTKFNKKFTSPCKIETIDTPTNHTTSTTRKKQTMRIAFKEEQRNE